MNFDPKRDMTNPLAGCRTVYTKPLTRGNGEKSAVSQFEFSVVNPLATSADYMSGDLKGREVPPPVLPQPGCHGRGSYLAANLAFFLPPSGRGQPSVLLPMLGREPVLKAGDVVIKRKRDMPAMGAFAVVMDDGVAPTEFELLTLNEARKRAEKWVAETSGTIHELDEDTGEPFSN